MATEEDLEILVENATDEIQDIVEEIDDGDDFEAQLGQLISDLCTRYRRRAAACFFLEADTGAFYRDLFKSAQAFLYFLKRASEDSAIDRYPLTTGRSAPFFDAIAGQNMALARAIAQHSPQTFADGDEYEDDFFYYHFLMRLYFFETDKKELTSILGQLSSAVTQESTYKAGICKALLGKDSEGFNENLSTLLLAHQGTYDRYREQEIEQDDIIDVESNISIEGLALIRLAEIRDIVTAKEYRLIPGISRHGTALLPMQEDAWKTP
ncbi:MAG: hypothetical protein GXP08_04860 [Gammaproteobacteria bacterium]|nr:hypothetical protein [Gammaproteobacteria bacterium]